MEHADPDPYELLAEIDNYEERVKTALEWGFFDYVERVKGIPDIDDDGSQR